MWATLRLPLAVCATFHLATPAALPGAGQSSDAHPSPVMTNVEWAQDLGRASSEIYMISVAADSHGPSARTTAMPLDVASSNSGCTSHLSR